MSDVVRCPQSRTGQRATPTHVPSLPRFSFTMLNWKKENINTMKKINEAKEIKATNAQTYIYTVYWCQHDQKNVVKVTESVMDKQHWMNNTRQTLISYHIHSSQSAALKCSLWQMVWWTHTAHNVFVFSCMCMKHLVVHHFHPWYQMWGSSYMELGELKDMSTCSFTALRTTNIKTVNTTW